MSNKKLNEATVSSSSSGKYQAPLSPGIREFNKQELQPFYVPTSKYDDAELAYDSYDGKMSTPKNKIKKMETNARKISKYIKNHPTISDDDGNNLNSGNGSSKPLGKTPKNENIKDLIKNVLREDLAVWFGTKKKPKGSKQPKGPWVNICRKKEGGGHPPCGRPEASDKGYPKCRAAGVASKMTDSQKRSACQQKRTAEKSHSKSGTGNKPKMTHYKPKNKQNEDMKKNLRLTESDLVRLVKKIINEQTQGTEMSFDKFKELVKKEGFTTTGTMSIPLNSVTGVNTVKIYRKVGQTEGAATNHVMIQAKNPLRSYKFVKKLSNNQYEVLVAVKAS